MRNRMFEKTLQEKFRRVYFSRERTASTDLWQQQAMARIRKIGPLPPAEGFWATLEPIVWRLAPVNIALILILLLLNMGFDTGYDYLGSPVAGLDRPSLSEFFGVEG